MINNIPLNSEKTLYCSYINLDSKKTELISNLKTYASDYIYKLYPQYKQTNALLGIYDNEDSEYLSKMSFIINVVRGVYNKLKEDILTINTLEELISKDFSYERFVLDVNSLLDIN